MTGARPPAVGLEGLILLDCPRAAGWLWGRLCPVISALQ